MVHSKSNRTRITTGKNQSKRHKVKPLGVMAIRRNEKIAADLVKMEAKMARWRLIKHGFVPVFSTCEYCGEPADGINEYGKRIHL
jgi:hypothetical protein